MNQLGYVKLFDSKNTNIYLYTHVITYILNLLKWD